MVQQYIHNPLLIKGRKFDIRGFLYFPCFKPLVAMYYPGKKINSLLYIQEFNLKL